MIQPCNANLLCLTEQVLPRRHSACFLNRVKLKNYDVVYFLTSHQYSYFFILKYSGLVYIFYAMVSVVQSESELQS